jgi:hypothetical protein
MIAATIYVDKTLTFDDVRHIAIFSVLPLVNIVYLFIICVLVWTTFESDVDFWNRRII